MLTTEALVAELKEDSPKAAAAGVPAVAAWAACTKSTPRRAQHAAPRLGKV